KVHVGGGGLDPSGTAASSLSLERAREIIAIHEAQGVSALSAAQKRVQAEKQVQDALKATHQLLQAENADWAKRYQNAGTDPKSFMGQDPSRASSGLKASDTSW